MGTQCPLRAWCCQVFSSRGSGRLLGFSAGGLGVGWLWRGEEVEKATSGLPGVSGCTDEAVTNKIIQIEG